MTFPNERTDLKALTKYYYVSTVGTIYKMSNTNNGCSDVKQLTNSNNIKITITYKDSSSGEEKVTKSYVYLDSYINEGDTWNNGDVKPHECSNKIYSTLAEKYKEEVKEYITTSIIEGDTKEKLKKHIPYYFLFNKSTDKSSTGLKISDTKTITNVEPLMYIDFEKDINSAVEEKAEKSAITEANRILKTIDKEVDSLTMTTKTIA